MTSDIGFICLVLALASAVYGVVAHAVGIKLGRENVLQSARHALIAVAALTTLAVAVLLGAILGHNFQLEYVANYTSRAMSFIYLVSSLWAGNDGSLLFWAWLLAIFSLIAVLRRGDDNRALIPHAALILMVIEAFFLLLLIATANPFGTLDVIPPDGRGLNPLLENPGMVIHPPLLLGGYVILAIPFAFAVAALLKGRLDNLWAIATRRWMILAWLLLGLGNIIGAWWAYVELGWGGYWAWDPVENAGLMPWLTMTAFLHSMLMQRWRGIFRVWNMTLVIVSFGLVIFGTFMTRGGMQSLNSVHTYNETSMGPFFLVFLAIIMLGSLGLLIWRYRDVKGDGGEMDAFLSRESSFFLNNILLVGAATVILFATIFPSLTEAFRGVTISLDSDWFDQVVGPVFLVIVALIGVCSVIGWRRTTLRALLKALVVPLAGALVVGIVLAALRLGAWQAVVSYAVCAFVGLSVLLLWWREVWPRRGSNLLVACWGQLLKHKPRYGAYLVHLAIVLITFGVIGSSFFNVETQVSLSPGETVTFEGYTLTFNGLAMDETPDKQIVSADISLTRDGKDLGTLTPEKYFHRSMEQSVTEVAIRSRAHEDLYVILAGWTDGGAVADFDLLVEPLVVWIWVGGGVFLVGGLLAFWGDRRRQNEVTGEDPAPENGENKIPPQAAVK